jgi:integrase
MGGGARRGADRRSHARRHAAVLGVGRRGLQWGDIDWRRSYIHVQRAWVRSAWTSPKNGEDRTVDMSGQLRTELRLWRRRQSREWMRRGLSRPELVFPSNVRTPQDDSKVRKIFGAIVRKAELRHRSVHAMRHCFISLLLQNGESPAYVQKQAGHKSMDITVNVYGHFMLAEIGRLSIDWTRSVKNPCGSRCRVWKPLWVLEGDIVVVLTDRIRRFDCRVNLRERSVPARRCAVRLVPQV